MTRLQRVVASLAAAAVILAGLVACQPIKGSPAGRPTSGLMQASAECSPDPDQDCLLLKVEVQYGPHGDLATPDEGTFPIHVTIDALGADMVPLQDKTGRFLYPVSGNVLINPWQAPITWTKGDVGLISAAVTMDGALRGYQLWCRLVRTDGLVVDSEVDSNSNSGSHPLGVTCEFPSDEGMPKDPFDPKYHP